MPGIVRHFRWIVRPHLFVGFLVASLWIGGLGALASSQPPDRLPVPQHAAAVTKGAATTTPMAPPVNCAAIPCIALTFDDGPDPEVTPRVLDILARQQVHATFFLVGREVPGREPIIKRMYQEGNEIGNHSWNHPDFTKLSPQAMQHEWQSTEAAISNAGVPAPWLFRPPYGAVTPAVRAQVPLTIVRWDVDTEDWLTRDPAKIHDHFIHDLHPGAIVLMHDKYHATADVLEPAIAELKQRYQLVTVSQLLGLQAGDQGQYFNR